MTATSTLINVVAPAEQHRILQAADSLFTEHSIAAVTFTDVAERAGVDVLEVSDSYPTKRDLLVAVLAYKHQGWVHRLERNGQKIDDPRDEILAVFSYLEECFIDTTWRGCCFVNAYAELGREDQGIADLALEHFREVERHMASLCLRADLPDYVSQALTILIQGARAEAGIHHHAGPARSARMAAAMLMSVYQTDPAGPDFF